MKDLDADELRACRRNLTASLVALSDRPSPQAAASFQRTLAESLLRAEAQLGRAPRANREIVHEHIRLLRAHGDALAWTQLHPHAIRQFRKGGTRPQSLSSQRVAVEEVLAVVDDLASAGTLALVADLTCDLRLGDLVIVDDPEAPTIVECKRKLPPDNSVLLGRRGRQAARLQGTAEYLHKGKAHLHGEVLTRLCIESGQQREPQWEMVRAAVDLALAQGVGNVSAIEAGSALWVQVEDEPLPASLVDACRDFSAPIIGAHSRFLDEDAPLMPPPLAWPLCEEARWRLSEGGLAVVMIVDAARFSELAAKQGRTVRVLHPLALEVVSNGVPYLASDRFIADCVYNFYSIADQVALLLEFVDQVAALGIQPAESHAMPEVSSAATPQRVHRVQSEDDIRRLAERSLGAGDSVMISSELFAKIAPGEPPRVVFWETGPPESDE